MTPEDFKNWRKDYSSAETLEDMGPDSAQVVFEDINILINVLESTQAELEKARQLAEDRLQQMQADRSHALGWKKDAERLLFVCKDFDGFENVIGDKYDFAMGEAIFNSREEPTPEDELNGLRRMIDAARSQTT